MINLSFLSNFRFCLNLQIFANKQESLLVTIQLNLKFQKKEKNSYIAISKIYKFDRVLEF